MKLLFNFIHSRRHQLSISSILPLKPATMRINKLSCFLQRRKLNEPIKFEECKRATTSLQSIKECDHRLPEEAEKRTLQLAPKSAPILSSLHSLPLSRETTLPHAKPTFSSSPMLLENQLKENQQREACRNVENQKVPKPNSKSTAANCKVQDPKEYFENRMKDLGVLKDVGTNPNPHTFFVTLSISEYMEKYGGLDNGDCLENVQVSLAGRITSKHPYSSKLLFYNLYGGGSVVRVVTDAKNSGLEEAEFSEFHSSVKQYDIVGVTGFPAKSKRGELSILSKSFVVLSHCLHMVPSQDISNLKNASGNKKNPDFYLVNNEETGCPHRCLDLMLNSNVRDMFKTRSKVISFMKKFLDNLDFLEVFTPVMSTVSSGAAASSFVAHHNELNTTLYMRTTSDLYLRRLVVGGVNCVYEIGKQFLNDSLDLRNNHQFMTCKFYMAYADYNNMMELSEKMLSVIVKELTGGFIIKCQCNNIVKETTFIDFTPPFRRIDVIEELERLTDLSIPHDLYTEEANKYLMDACMKYNLRCLPPQTTACLLDKLVQHFVKETCVNPTFIMNYPEILRPNANSHISKPGRTECFELFVNNHYLCEACTELTDPMVLRQRMAKQHKDPQLVDNETMGFDKTLCILLEHGMPPTASCGLDIDRLVMLLTDRQCLNEVFSLPALKPGFEQATKQYCLEYSSPSLKSDSSPSILSSSFRIAIVGDIHDEWKIKDDSKALHLLNPDLLMFTGDFGNENVELVKSVTKLNLPKAAILGNHDSWSTSKFSNKTKDGVQVQLECLGKAHVGYGHLEVPQLKLSVVGGRPFSCGGNQLFRKKLLTPRYGVHDMEESAEKIYQAALRTPEEHSIIFLAHNGPTGLGSHVDDICGMDWEGEGTDFGDPDLAKAISQLKNTTKFCIPLVVFGHMHKDIGNGVSRKMVAVDADNTMYLNAAIVPRVRYLSSGGSTRAFTVVEFCNGQITKVAETWVSIIDDKASVENEFLLFSI